MDESKVQIGYALAQSDFVDKESKQRKSVLMSVDPGTELQLYWDRGELAFSLEVFNDEDNLVLRTAVRKSARVEEVRKYLEQHFGRILLQRKTNPQDPDIVKLV